MNPFRVLSKLAGAVSWAGLITMYVAVVLIALQVFHAGRAHGDGLGPVWADRLAAVLVGSLAVMAFTEAAQRLADREASA